MSDTVTISKAAYAKLLDDSAKLNSLINGGVDNWEWYYEALADYRAWKGEEEDDE